MLMLDISSAAKLVAMAVASFMLASTTTTTTAAPVLNLHNGGSTLPVIDCVKIQGTDINRSSLLQGERLPITIDTSGCDPSLVDTTQPWTLTLVNCQNHADTLKLADLVGGGADQKEYNWAVQTQPNTILNININTASTTDSTNKYHIQVDAPSKDGTERLTGKTASFTIDTNKSLQKRDDEVPVVTEVPLVPVVDEVTSPGAPAVNEVTSPDAPVVNEGTSPDTPVVNEVTRPDVPIIDEVTTPDTPTVEGTTIPEGLTDVNDPKDISPAAATPATTPAAPATNPDISTVPVPPIVPSTTYPNIPFEILDPDTLPSPSGPNQPASYDPQPPQVIVEPKKGPSTSEVFFKYAGAGSAILSTIGLGLGGLVGGIVGGTAGLVIGISAALINSLYYAPNVA